MRALFRFDPAAWATAPARRTIETLATLLETPYRLAGPGEPARAGEALVHVGAVASAPADAAAVIAVEGWPGWEARTLERRVVAGEPLPCPPGTGETPETQESGAAFPAAWLRAAAFTLAREEELQDARRDQWRCYSGAYTRLGSIGLLEQPFVNRMALSLQRRLEAHAASRQARLERVPRWKGDAPFAVALTHDVDDVTRYSARQAWRLIRQARSPGSYAFRAGVSGLGAALARPRGATDPYWSFERWMDEEERRGFRSTFYFCTPSPVLRHEYDALYTLDDSLGYQGRRITVAELLRETRRRGHEVGLHGSYLSYTLHAELAAERERIARALGAPVAGIRQHFLRLELEATWQAQAAAGFEYDTTLGYNEALGFRAGIAAPYRPWRSASGDPFGPWQLPLTAMDGTLFRTLKLGAEAAAEAVARQLDIVREVGGLAVLLWHPNAADEHAFPGWWACYLAVLDEVSRRGAWVAPAAEVKEWWADRAVRLGAGG